MEEGTHSRHQLGGDDCGGVGIVLNETNLFLEHEFNQTTRLKGPCDGRCQARISRTSERERSGWVPSVLAEAACLFSVGMCLTIFCLCFNGPSLQRLCVVLTDMVPKASRGMLWFWVCATMRHCKADLVLHAKQLWPPDDSQQLLMPHNTLVSGSKATSNPHSRGRFKAAHQCAARPPLLIDDSAARRGSKPSGFGDLTRQQMRPLASSDAPHTLMSRASTGFVYRRIRFR